MTVQLKSTQIWRMFPKSRITMISLESKKARACLTWVYQLVNLAGGHCKLNTTWDVELERKWIPFTSTEKFQLSLKLFVMLLEWTSASHTLLEVKITRSTFLNHQPIYFLHTIFNYVPYFRRWRKVWNPSSNSYQTRHIFTI